MLVRRLGSRQKGERVLFPPCVADFSQFGFMPVFTTMRDLPNKVEMDLHRVEKWAWVKRQRSPEQ